MDRLIQFVWNVAAAFFLLSVLVAAVGFPWWRRAERKAAAETEEKLRLLKYDTTGEHIFDA